MMKRSANSYVNGTAALEMPRWIERPDEATIIAFPSSHRACREDGKDRPGAREEGSRNSKSQVRRMLDSSEMYCSLRFESMRGVPYHLFTNKGIAVLSTGAAVMGVVSLILGA